MNEVYLGQSGDNEIVASRWRACTTLVAQKS